MRGPDYLPTDWGGGQLMLRAVGNWQPLTDTAHLLPLLMCSTACAPMLAVCRGGMPPQLPPAPAPPPGTGVSCGYHDRSTIC